MLYVRTYEDWRMSGGLHNPEKTETPGYLEKFDKKHKEKFLIDYDYTYNWILKYHPKLEIDYPPDEPDYQSTAKLEIENRIKYYMDLYKKSKLSNIIDIQRKICIKELNDIDINKLGLFWSFQPTDIGFVTIDNPYYEVIFYGYTNYNNVNWENSLDNFVYYGFDESEVKLYPNSKVTITKANILYRKKWNKVESVNTSIFKTFPFITNI
jgi:hypothetical protein